MSHAIPKEIKNQILSRVKEGVPVSQLAKEHGVGDKTIYTWLRKQSITSPSVLALGRLKRERDDLLKLVGELSLRLKKGEKSKFD